MREPSSESEDSRESRQGQLAIKVRRYREDDREDILRVAERAFGYRGIRPYIEWGIESSDLIYVAEVNGEIAGFLQIELHELAGRRFAYVYYVVTDKRWQRRGVATSLLRRAFRDLPKLGYKELWATANVRNIPSIRLLIKNGFRLVSREEFRMIFGKYAEEAAWRMYLTDMDLIFVKEL